MVSFPSRSVSGNARYCELRRPWRQARSCNVAAASYIKKFFSLARGGAPAPLAPPLDPPLSWGGGSWGEDRSRWGEANPGGRQRWGEAAPEEGKEAAPEGGQRCREAAPACERAELGEGKYQECNKFVRFTDCL